MPMDAGRLRTLGLAAGTSAAAAAAWVSHLPQRPGLAAADAAVGLAFAGLGLLSWRRGAAAARSGLLMTATGFAWFAGSFTGAALFLHHGPLAHLLVGYPRGRLRSRAERAVVAAAYVEGAVLPLARQEVSTITLSALLSAVVLRRFLTTRGPERQARSAAVLATAATVLPLATGAVARLVGSGIDTATLWAYQLAMTAVAVGLFTDLSLARWTRTAVTGLVLDLGSPAREGALRARLARAVGDPSLALGYRLPGTTEYVDESGRPVELPAADAERTVTYLHEGGRRIGAIVHDTAVLDDPVLVRAVTATASMALSNSRLQAEVRAQVSEVEASRLRLVEAGTAERRRLERELRDGAERRLARVAGLLAAGDGPESAGVLRELRAAQAALTEFARGVHPRTLTSGGLGPALAELRTRCPVPLRIDLPQGRLRAAAEEALYYTCAEALTNMAKHARATRAAVRIELRADAVVAEVHDDGAGGADPDRGSGLRGLADRIAALHGRFSVESPPGGGTRLRAELPLSPGDATP